MPILFIGVAALAVFLSMFFMFLSAMLSERREHEKQEAAKAELPKAAAQTAGR